MPGASCGCVGLPELVVCILWIWCEGFVLTTGEERRGEGGGREGGRGDWMRSQMCGLDVLIGCVVLGCNKGYIRG